jgi:hypothetical protein
MWTDFENGCIVKLQSKLHLPTDRIDGCNILSFSTTFMPLVLIPLTKYSFQNEFNSYYHNPEWDGIRNKLNVKCDDNLTLRKINNECTGVDYREYDSSCKILQEVIQKWSYKYNWWLIYEKYDRGNIWIRAKLVSKNGDIIKIKF